MRERSEQNRFIAVKELHSYSYYGRKVGVAKVELSRDESSRSWDNRRQREWHGTTSDGEHWWIWLILCKMTSQGPQSSDDLNPIKKELEASKQQAKHKRMKC